MVMFLSTPVIIHGQADDDKWRTTQAPNQITVGPDDNLWFTEETLIGRITPEGDVTEFALPEWVFRAGDIAAGPDRALWFTLQGSVALGRMTTEGQFTVFMLPDGFGDARGITVGPDGQLWFTSYADWKVGRLNPDGTVTIFPIKDGNVVGAITVGSDDNLWFINDWGSRIVRLTPQGEVTQFPIPTWAAGRLRDIAEGSDGRLWYTDMLGGIIGRVTVDGEFDEYRLVSGSFPVGLAQARDRSMCFAEANRDRIGCISQWDTLTYLSLPPRSGPVHLTTGPDGNLWVTASSAKRILVVSPPRRTFLPLIAR